MTAIKEPDGKLNIWAKEPTMYIDKKDMDQHCLQTHNEKAEIWNSRAAMLGVIAGLVSYCLTGKLFFGIY